MCTLPGKRGEGDRHSMSSFPCTSQRMSGSKHWQHANSKASRLQTFFLRQCIFSCLLTAVIPLAAYYASCGGNKDLDANAAVLFLDFCRRREADLIPLIEAGVTNTNEVGRSCFLAPGYQAIAAMERQALSLIEIGPSAGFNLNFDRYGYQFSHEDSGEQAVFWQPSAFTLQSVAKGSAWPPLGERPPEVESRCGLELHPVDIRQSKDRQWIRALVWPERIDRLKKLDAALAIAAEVSPPIVAGDALVNLPEAIAAAPLGTALCISHSLVIYQFTKEMRAQLDAMLLAASKERAIFRLWLEFDPQTDRYPLKLTSYEGGDSTSQSLANCDPHGLWVEWLA